MSSAALLQLLPDFGPAPGQDKPAPAAAREPAADARPAADIGQLIAEAVAEAEAALEARLTAAHQAELAAVRQEGADQAKALLDTFGTDIGAVVSGRMDAMAGELAEVIGAAAARSIGAVLSERLQERSLAALSATIAHALDAEDAVRIRVEGPASLFESLAAALGDRAAIVDFVEAPSFDLTVVIGDAVLETRMSEWAAALTEILS